MTLSSIDVQTPANAIEVLTHCEDENGRLSGVLRRNGNDYYFTAKRAYKPVAEDDVIAQAALNEALVQDLLRLESNHGASPFCYNTYEESARLIILRALYDLQEGETVKANDVWDALVRERGRAEIYEDGYTHYLWRMAFSEAWYFIKGELAA